MKLHLAPASSGRGAAWKCPVCRTADRVANALAISTPGPYRDLLTRQAEELAVKPHHRKCAA